MTSHSHTYSLDSVQPSTIFIYEKNRHRFTTMVKWNMKKKKMGILNPKYWANCELWMNEKAATEKKKRNGIKNSSIIHVKRMTEFSLIFMNKNQIPSNHMHMCCCTFYGTHKYNIMHGTWWMRGWLCVYSVQTIWNAEHVFS